MSRNSERKKAAEISRRTLLKAGALAAGAAPTIQRAAQLPGPAGVGSDGDAEVRSCCQFCQCRCTTLVRVKKGKVANVHGNPDSYWSEGALCPKAQAMVELTYSPHRLLYPLKREGSKWKRIPYLEAVDLVAREILKIKAEFPEDYAHHLVMFAPMWDSHESELAASMALKLSGFPDIYHPGDTCIGNSALALDLALGSAINSTTLDEALNSRLLILWGANVSETYPVCTRWIDKARGRGTKVVYIDPRRTPTSNHCDEQLLPRPGTDGALALGLVRALIREKRYDSNYVEKHVNGFKELAEACEPYSADKVAQICRISEKQVTDLAARCGNSTSGDELRRRGTPWRW